MLFRPRCLSVYTARVITNRTKERERELLANPGINILLWFQPFHSRGDFRNCCFLPYLWNTGSRGPLGVCLLCASSLWHYLGGILVFLHHRDTSNLSIYEQGIKFDSNSFFKLYFIKILHSYRLS